MHGGQSVADAQRDTAGRIRTSIDIIAVSSSEGGAQIDVWIKYVGSQPVTAISMSDVFLTQTGTRFDAFTYDPDPGAPDNTWQTVPADATWSRGETLHILIDSVEPVVGTGDHTLIVSTPNGITAEKSFQQNPLPTPTPTPTP